MTRAHDLAAGALGYTLATAIWGGQLVCLPPALAFAAGLRLGLTTLRGAL